MRNLLSLARIAALLFPATMARHTYPKKRADDLAFPVRVKVRVPDKGFGGMLDEMFAWALEYAGPGCFTNHPGDSATGRHVAALYFRSVAIAVAFFERFPALELADDVVPDGRVAGHHSTPSR